MSDEAAKEIVEIPLDKGLGLLAPGVKQLFGIDPSSFVARYERQADGELEYLGIFQNPGGSQRCDAMTPEQFEAAMRQLCFGATSSKAIDRPAADALMCQCLREIGYGAGVEIFEKAHKSHRVGE
jgi:hypothetical protein